MKKWIASALLSLALFMAMPASAWAQELVVGGQAVGIRVETPGVMVVGLASVETAEGSCSPAADAGFQTGDIVTKIGETEIHTAADFLAAVAALEGEAAEVTAKRGDKTIRLTVQPALSAEEQWMFGMLLRDGVSGIGTLTFCDPISGAFGALGHAVSDDETGAALPLESGRITDAQIVDVIPGTQGSPGELNGFADAAQVLGNVEKNSDKGIFGQLLLRPAGRLAEIGQITPGPATILCTVQAHEVEEYTVQIDRVYSEGGCRRIMLTVTDPALCERTGGIVQGMSGSPILQDGKLVGALTHVFVAEPRRGYGLCIQDMMAEAGLTLENAA